MKRQSRLDPVRPALVQHQDRHHSQVATTRTGRQRGKKFGQQIVLVDSSPCCTSRLKAGISAMCRPPLFSKEFPSCRVDRPRSWTFALSSFRCRSFNHDRSIGTMSMHVSRPFLIPASCFIQSVDTPPITEDPGLRLPMRRFLDTVTLPSIRNSIDNVRAAAFQSACGPSDGGGSPG